MIIEGTCLVSGSIKLFSITKQSWDTCRVSSLIDFIYFQNFLLFPVNDSSKGQFWYFTNRVRSALPGQNVTRLTRRTRPSFNPGSNLCLHDVYKLKSGIYVLKSILFLASLQDPAGFCGILQESCTKFLHDSCKIPLDLAGVQEKGPFLARAFLLGDLWTIEQQRVTSQVLWNHFRGAKQYGLPMEREHFSLLHIC